MINILNSVGDDYYLVSLDNGDTEILHKNMLKKLKDKGMVYEKKFSDGVRKMKKLEWVKNSYIDDSNTWYSSSPLNLLNFIVSNYSPYTDSVSEYYTLIIDGRYYLGDNKDNKPHLFLSKQDAKNKAQDIFEDKIYKLFFNDVEL
jgi:hypothetical protein